MRVKSLYLVVVVVLTLMVPAGSSFAGQQTPKSIRVEKAQFSSDASAVFTCETRFFNRYLNPLGGVACYGPAAIRTASRALQEGDHGWIFRVRALRRRRAGEARP